MTVCKEIPDTALIIGADGFIGRHIARALYAAGYRVVHGVSPRRHARVDHLRDARDILPMDFAQDDTNHWLQRFGQRRQPCPISIVVNAAGVWRDHSDRPMQATHQSGPIALFDACASSPSVRRVIQISALGIEDNPTRYASTKRAADAHLLALTSHPRTHQSFTAVVLRPSLVFGRGGASSRLFMRLARAPLACLPGPVFTAQVQPVAVADLADAVVALAHTDNTDHGILPVTGPQALPLAALIASLRQQCSHPPAKMLRLPDLLTRLSARIGDWIPASSWCSAALALLAQDNVGDAAILRRLLDRDAVHYNQLVESAWQQS